MSTNIVIALDTRRSKKDGAYPIILRLSHNRKTIPIATGYSVLEKEWDYKNRCIRKSYKGVSSVSRLNNLLAKKKSDAMEVITKLEEQNELSFLSITQVKAHIAKRQSSNSFFAFGEKLVEEMKAAQQFGNATVYKGALDFLKRHSHGNDLSFLDINYDFIKKLEISHLSKGNSPNGLSVYLRTIRAIYSKAIKAKLVAKEAYPFEDYKIKTVPTRKRALSAEGIEKIINLPLEPTHECFYARNYFLASYMMYGMSFIDLAFLKKENIIDGRIKYQRKKTSANYDIKINEALFEILNFYMEADKANDFVFPIIKRENLEDQIKDAKWARKRYNKKLKELAKLCKIEETLTSYVSRHTFASKANTLGIPVTAISNMLGHKKLSTTQIYLANLSSTALDDFNEQVLNG